VNANIKRREFVTLLGGAAAVWPLVARAQQPAMPVVGFLSIPSAVGAAFLASFRKGLSEAGFVEGRNVAIEYSFAGGDISRLPALAAELVSRRVTVLFVVSSAAALAAKAATSTIPIVFAAGVDPVKSGLVASLNQPGGNTTGVSFLVSELEAKRLGLLHELVPKVDLIAVLLNPNGLAFGNQSREIDAAARALGLKLHIERARNERNIDAAFEAFAQKRAGALLVGADPYYESRRDLVVALALQYRLPSIYWLRELAEAGGLMSYGTSVTDSFRQGGDYVGRILKGEKPADLPVMQSTKFELVINLKTARTLGLDVPDRLLAIADEVIE
jgi:putative ABC transport system substrate-binding protein